MSCLQQAVEWLQTCQGSHPQCASIKTRSTRPPSRLIDVGLGSESKDPYLCLANESVRSWVALSYCWGGESDFVLNDRTVEPMTRGIKLSEFPATLRDAVTITRKLGIRHLWIDALCIKQDSADDWRQECSRMRDVYKGATLTLIAANAPSVETGIFSKRTRLDSCSLPWGLSHDGGRLSSAQGNRVHIRPSSWNEETETWPTQRRGWTLQEELLSPRTLSYSKRRMVWECSTHQIDEGGRITWPSERDVRTILQDILRNGERRLPPWVLWKVHQIAGRISVKWNLGLDTREEHPYYGWTNVVDTYTSRSLTKEMDMLPGIAGLASEFARQTRDTYCAGLWQKRLLAGLMWSLHPVPASKTDTPITGPAEYRAPSWSWASINGEIRFRAPFVPRTKVQEWAKVVAVRVKPLASSDPFGQVKAGHLVLQGKFYHVCDSLENGSTAASASLPAAQKVLQASILFAPAMLQEFRQQHKPCCRQHFALLQLTAWFDGWGRGGAEFLILESAARDASVYRRIGVIILRHKLVYSSGISSDPQDDPLAFTFTDNDFAALASDAFQELQEANVKEKKVKII